jgi:rubredoxin
MRGRMGGMEFKPPPTPLVCPVCTSREVTVRGWTDWGRMVRFGRGSILKMLGIVDGEARPPRTNVARYRCKQCGHKFTVPKK